MSVVKIGVAGPVGSGKTALIEALIRKMHNKISLGVVTNDIYTKADSQKIVDAAVIEEGRIIGIETGGCPHLAIREDVSMNLNAVKELEKRYPDIKLVFVESGGDNLAASFSPDLADATIYVISVAEGGDIPTKGGPGITRSDLLVVNKIDLAPYVGVDMEQLEKDVKFMRKNKKYIFTNVRGDENVDQVVDWIMEDVLLMEEH